MEAVEIACDESGYEGERLVGTTTDVFAHAGVHLPDDVAVECLRELRRRIRSPATEYKANHLLREKHRAVLVWLLGPSSPLFRNAHLFLIDKVRYLLGRLGALVLTEAGELHHLVTGNRLLVAANDLLRGKERQDVRGPVDAFFAVLGDGMGAAAARDRALALRLRMKEDPSLSVLDPLIPALLRAVARWGGDGRPVTILHDRQTMLPAGRVAGLQRTLREDGLTLQRVRLAAAESEPRVQLANILAGTVRSIAQEELHGRGDPELTMLAGPYVDPSSIWGDRPSWTRRKPS
ncbi:hypothetical protein AB0J80_24645 [Actinoplanes sp. NPDC049548]|uniref:hypothetical protein n=1 Tax=Actinoplanes sp. NPDC049548 TaxID=3155152 RepID=UPI0034214DB2